MAKCQKNDSFEDPETINMLTGKEKFKLHRLTVISKTSNVPNKILSVHLLRLLFQAVKGTPRPLVHSTEHSSLRRRVKEMFSGLLLKFGIKIAWPCFHSHKIARPEIG